MKDSINSIVFSQSLHRIDDIINFLPDATIVIDTHKKIIAWNKAAELMTGIVSKDMLGKGDYVYAIPFYGVRRPLLVDLVINYDENWAKNYLSIDISDNILRAEIFCPAVNKTGAYVRATAAPLYDSNYNIVGAIESMREITSEKKAVEALKHSEKMYRNIVETANEGIIILDKESKIVFLNNKLARMLGYLIDEIIGQSVYKLIGENQISKMKSLIRRRHKKISEKYDIELICKNGSILSVIIFASPILDSEGNYIGGLGMITDITEFKKMEQYIAQLDRLNIVGEIAAGIGHEIRNPLTSVRGFLQLLQNKNKYREDNEYFKMMIEELDRANSIITEFLSLSKHKLVELKKCSLNNIINSVFPLLQAEALVQNKYICKELQDIPDLLLDEGEIRQLLLNLIKNGLDAMQPGKSIFVKTYIKNDKIVLEIQDQGCGIETNILNEIAIPFFSTKREGTGLGLPICYSITARHNATIEIKTAPSGTTIFIEFLKMLGK